MTAAATPAPTLEARGLTKHFTVRQGGMISRRARLHAVDDVSLTVTAGRVTAVVGESGSGKSVLARMLARIITPSAGELYLQGEQMPLGQAGRRKYASEVQLVLQDPFSSMNPVHGVRHHIARPLRIHGTAGKDLDGAIKDVLRRVALDPPERFIDSYPHELSGGQLQRVSFARALAVRPRVLLADEPVSMLDVSIRLGVLNLLAELRESERLAILYITHDIASARYLADEVLVMYAGEVVERAPAVTLTDTPAHPYTQLLLSAAPDPARGKPAPLSAKGAPPRLVAPPPGCKFHPRCPHAMAICKTTAPRSFLIAPGHAASCWLHAPSGERKSDEAFHSAASVARNESSEHSRKENVSTKKP
ncbi:MAG: ABC transporter ATP-binding protein [Acidimicrobiales bacterium]